MKLEQQVVGLELAQKLKELGVKQESFFKYGNVTTNDGVFWDIYVPPEYNKIPHPDLWVHGISAFTVAELGEMLPDYTQELGNLEISKCDTDHFNMQRKEKRWWNVSYWTWKNVYSKSGDIYLERESKHLQQADTEADARAKMLVYLLENNLITA